MKLFVGLGNPGAKYARNRHNIGFMAVDEIARDHGFSPWRGKFQGQVAEGHLGGQKLLLLKPETYMNKSGHAVAAAAQFFKIPPSDIVVFHDELDLAPGKCRVKSGGGHAGHNGLRSIHANLGADYMRVRIGIGHPGHKDQVAHYVLHDFAKADEAWIDDLLRGISDGAAELAAGDAGRFMNAVSLRVAPPRSSKTPAPDRPTQGAPAKPGLKGEAPDQAQSTDQAPAKEAAKSPLQKLINKFR